MRSTTAEKSRWQREADALDISVSELIRAKMNNREIRVKMTADPALLGELNRQGNNFNQLMHAIHAGFPIAAARVLAVIELLQNYYRQEIARG